VATFTPGRTSAASPRSSGAGYRPGRRGQGHASAVLAELERRLAAKGCRKVNLLIEPDNDAVTGFYRQHGYTEDQLIFMEKWLHPGLPPHPDPPPPG
jgi:GNAT superfamily N-acetyltransferase